MTEVELHRLEGQAQTFLWTILVNYSAIEDWEGTSMVGNMFFAPLIFSNTPTVEKIRTILGIFKYGEHILGRKTFIVYGSNELKNDRLILRIGMDEVAVVMSPLFLLEN